MIELTENAELVGPWVYTAIGRDWSFAGKTCLGLLVDGELRAGAVFENYTQVSVQGHMRLTPTPALRRFIPAVFHYVFIDLGVNKLLGLVNSANDEALKTDLRLGFKPEAIIEGVFPDGDLVIMAMERRDCYWIPEHRRNAA